MQHINWPVRFAGRRISSFAGLAMMLVGTLAGPVLAQSAALSDTEVFTVRGVSVDITAETAAEARRIALRDGQAMALERMLRRLTRRVDYDALPAVDPETTAFFVRDFEVVNEKTSPVRYLADLTVRFKPAEIRRLLRQTGLPFAESASMPLIVLPVLKTPKGLLLWDASNAWRLAWASLPVRRGLVPLIVPIGDLADIADIDAGQAILGDPEAFTAISTRYEAGGALVALATLSVRDDGLVVLDVAASRSNQTGAAPVRFTFTAAPGDDVMDIMRVAAGETAEGIEDIWLSDHLLRFDTSRSMTLAISVRSLDEWVSVRRDLQEIAAISRLELRVLRRDSAEIEIEYFGDETQLAAALSRHGLELEDALPQIVVVGAGEVSTVAASTKQLDRVRVLRRSGH